MTLAYPGQKGDLWKAMARDAFVGALGDPNLRSKILEQDPPTVARSSAVADNFDDQGRRRDRLARGDGVGDDRGTATMARRIEELEAALQHCRGEDYMTGRGTCLTTQCLVECHNDAHQLAPVE